MSKTDESSSCFEDTSTTINITDRTVINRELTPILAELETLEPGNQHHPTVRKLFNWLVDPCRTGEEYTYVIGQLAEDVFCVMQAHFSNYMYDGIDFPYLCLSAAEALAVRCPVLEGSWEEAAWTLLIITQKRDFGDVSSNHFKSWLLHVIYNADICPNSYLRFELVDLLRKTINKCESTQIAESILSVCSSSNIDYIAFGSLLSNVFSPKTAFLKARIDKHICLNLTELSKFIEEISEDGSLREYDIDLARIIQDIKSSRCSTIIRDVSYYSAVHPQRFTVPEAICGLIALLKAALKCMQAIFKDIQNEIYVLRMGQRLFEIRSLSEVLRGIVRTFNKSCQTVLTVKLVSVCIMDIVELVIQVKMDFGPEHKDNPYMKIVTQKIVEIIGQVLESVFAEYDCLPLPSRVIRLDVTKTFARSSTNHSWDLCECRDVFHKFFPFLTF